MNKFEKLIEYIINEDEDKAKKLFHQIVVEHSRKIYEDLESEDKSAEDLNDDLSTEHDIIDGDEQGIEDLEDEGVEELEPETDELESEDGLEDRVMDLEDALDELKAEFDELLSQEEEEGHDFSGSDEAASDELDDVDSDEEDLTDVDAENDLDEEDDSLEDEEELPESVQRKTASALMREYVEKVAALSNAEGQEVGSGGKSVTVSAKSTVARPNDFGGTPVKFTQGGAEQQATGVKAVTNAFAKGQTKVSTKFQNAAGGSKKLSSVQKPSNRE